MSIKKNNKTIAISTVVMDSEVTAQGELPVSGKGIHEAIQEVNTDLQEQITDIEDNYVPTSRKINGQTLTEDITISTVGALNDLSDVSITNPTEGQSLTYDATNDMWKNSSTTTTVAWGEITGDIDNQPDLQNALGDKQDKLTSVNAGENISITDGGAHNLPEEYQEIAYIESSGSQFIDLGQVFKDTDVMEAKAAMLEDTGLSTLDKYFIAPSSWNTNTNRFALGGFHGPQTTMARIFTCAFGNIRTGQSGYSPTILANNDVYTFKYQNRAFSMAGTTSAVYNVTSATWGGDTTELKLFYGYNAPTKCRIYSYKHTRGDNDLTNFVPCYIKATNEVGMYDLVSQTFCGNDGTGEFIAGEEISNTLKISALHDDTKQNVTDNALTTASKTIIGAINEVNNGKQETLVSGTNIKTVNNQSLLGSGNIDIQSGSTYTAGEGINIEDDVISVNKNEIQEKLTAGDNITIVEGSATHNLPEEYQEIAYLESTGTQYIDAGIAGIAGVSTEVKFKLTDLVNSTSILGARQRFRFFAPVTHEGKFDITASTDKLTIAYDNKIHVVELITNSNSFNSYVDGTLYASGTPTLTDNSNLFLFARSNANGAEWFSKAQVYYLKIWQGNTLALEFVPARRKADNVLGMYDLVSETFFTNQGTGTFIAGPDVFPATVISAQIEEYTANEVQALWESI